MKTYTLINYFDTWKDENGCWTVNNQCIEAEDIVITNDAIPKDICTYLMNAGYLKTNDMRKLVVDDYADGLIEVYQRKDMVPLFGLREKI